MHTLQKNVDKLNYYIAELIIPSDIITISEIKLKEGHLQTNIDLELRL